MIFFQRSPLRSLLSLLPLLLLALVSALGLSGAEKTEGGEGAGGVERTEGAVQPRANAATATDAPQRAPFYLITDYLPPASYVGDPITCCFRVENTTASDVEIELLAVPVDGAGKELKAQAQSLRVPSKSDRPLQFNIDSTDARGIAFKLKRSGAAEPEAVLQVRLLHEDEAWPLARFRNGRMEDAASGAAIVPVVRKRLVAHDRSYALLKWIVDPPPGETALAPGEGSAFVPGGWGLAAMAKEEKPRLRELGPYAPDGAAPILHASNDILRQVSDAKGQAAMKRLVIALPPEDFEVHTDPRVYQLALEVLLAHLKRLGVREIVLIPPARYGVDKDLRDAYWKSVYEVANIYACQAVDGNEYMRERWWRADPFKDGVYGAKPNKEGLKKFGQALSNLLP